MTKSKGTVQRRLNKLPDMTSPAPERERWSPPPRTPDSPDYKINMEIGELGRIIGHQSFDESYRMTEFCLTIQVYHAGAWWDVVRVDTKHGAVHAHYMYRTRIDGEPEEIKPIYCQGDVDSGYELAETWLVASWSDHVTRWNRGS